MRPRASAALLTALTLASCASNPKADLGSPAPKAAPNGGSLARGDAWGNLRCPPSETTRRTADAAGRTLDPPECAAYFDLWLRAEPRSPRDATRMLDTFGQPGDEVARDQMAVSCSRAFGDLCKRWPAPGVAREAPLTPGE